MSTSTPTAPSWYETYRTSFLSSEAHCFILHGDLLGYAYQAVTHRGFLLSQLASRRIVALYDIASGITFATPAMKQEARKLLEKEEPDEVIRNRTAARNQADPFAGALAGIGLTSSTAANEEDDPFSVTRPGEALEILEQLLRAPQGKGKVAVIFEYAEAICPPTPNAQMSPAGFTVLIKLRKWATDPTLGRCNNPVFLLTRNLADLHPSLLTSTSGYKGIEMKLPNYEARQAFLSWYLLQRKEQGTGIPLTDLTVEELSRMTAGLNLRHVEDILLLGERAGQVTRQLVKSRKDEIIQTENSDVAEMIEPLEGGFSQIGGMRHITTWARAEIITPIREGRLRKVPKGVLLVGPPGTGKTFFVSALAYELGFNAVSLQMENILGSLVGESEKKLKQFFDFCRALSPVLVFIDELDQSDLSRRGSGSGNPVAANMFGAMLRFMSDPSLRGKVVMMFASNRPDLVDKALLRFERIDAIIPFMLARKAEERLNIVVAQANMQQLTLLAEAAEIIAAGSNKYSSADIAAVVNKAGKLAERRGDGQAITTEDATLALQLIRPGTPTTADYYELLAVQACNDAELLPPEYSSLVADPKGLQSKIKEVAQETPGIREQRTE